MFPVVLQIKNTLRNRRFVFFHDFLSRGVFPVFHQTVSHCRYG